MSVASFSRVMSEMGHHVTIFTARHPEQDTVDDAHEGVYRLPSVTLPMAMLKVQYPLGIPWATWKAKKFFQEQHFDIIHSHSPMLIGHLARNYHRRRDIPMVFTYHTIFEDYSHYVPLPELWVRRRAIQLSRYYSNLADHIITPTECVASRLRRYQVTRPITVIPTGIDIDQIDLVPKVDLRAHYDIPDGVPLLVYAGRLAAEKNLPRILGAFRVVLRSEPDSYLLMVGGGPDEASLHALAEEYQITHRTRWTGNVPREYLIQTLHNADLFVFASITETQGLVLGEAMACHVPVVAVDDEAPREMLDSGIEGLLVPNADEPFAEAVVTLIRDKTLRTAMGIKARTRAESISAYRCTARLLDVYARILDGRTPDQVG